MLRPSRAQLALLRPTERACFEIADFVHRNAGVQAVVQPFQRNVGKGWVTATTGKLRHMVGLEHLRDLHPDRGVIFVSNHRSFFDFYVITAVIYANAPWVRRIFFPVRSSFFYDRLLGSAVNAIMSGWAMFPPILRSEKQRDFNGYSTDFIVEALQDPGTIVGFHPEGKRGTGDDPYQLLPAQAGIGNIIHKARPIVMPVFTLGLINDFPKQIRSNYDGSGAPITQVFGPPMDLSRFFELPAGPETSRAIADQVMVELSKLGEVERAFRAKEGLPDLSPKKA